MAVAIKFNNKNIADTGLVCCMNTVDGGEYILDVLQNTKNVDATGKISLNGIEVPRAFVTIDTGKNECTLESMESQLQELDLSKIHIEVNIFGDIDLD